MEKKFITTWFYASKQSEKRNVGILRNKVKLFMGKEPLIWKNTVSVLKTYITSSIQLIMM